MLGGKYEETQPTRYRVTQPRDGRKKGFLSGDAQKRDMCMNTCMNAIQTQTITKENRALKAAREKALEAHAELEASRPPRSGRLSAPPVLPTREEPLRPLSPQGVEKRVSKDKSRRRRRRPRPVTHDLSREDPLYEASPFSFSRPPPLTLRLPLTTLHAFVFFRTAAGGPLRARVRIRHWARRRGLPPAARPASPPSPLRATLPSPWGNHGSVAAHPLALVWGFRLVRKEGRDVSG